MRGDVKNLDWNGIIRPSCSVSLLNQAFLGVVGIVSIRTIVVRIGDKPLFKDC